jgi:hypothetical protein
MANASANTGVLRCAQDDDEKQATANANTEILRMTARATAVLFGHDY